MKLHQEILLYVSPKNETILLYDHNIIIVLKKFNIDMVK